MKNLENYISVSILVADAAQLAAVYALLGSTSTNAIVAAQPPKAPAPEKGSVEVAEVAEVAEEPAGEEIDESVVDAAGWPWDASLHASTRGTTKDGLWRMKVGVSRPDPKPGFPEPDGATGTVKSGEESPPSGSASGASAGAVDEEEDEFAAFRKAAEKSDAKVADAAPRKWTDADMGALCNQAAVKLGDPEPIKTVIAKFVPEGEVKHSRMVPADQREAFAQEIEKVAGITFAG